MLHEYYLQLSPTARRSLNSKGRVSLNLMVSEKGIIYKWTHLQTTQQRLLHPGFFITSLREEKEREDRKKRAVKSEEIKGEPLETY